MNTVIPVHRALIKILNVLLRLYAISIFIRYQKKTYRLFDYLFGGEKKTENRHDVSEFNIYNNTETTQNVSCRGNDPSAIPLRLISTDVLRAIFTTPARSSAGFRRSDGANTSTRELYLYARARMSAETFVRPFGRFVARSAQF